MRNQWKPEKDRVYMIIILLLFIHTYRIIFDCLVEGVRLFILIL